MPFSLRCVQYIWQVFYKTSNTLGVKSLLMVEKVLLMRNNLVAVLFWRPMQRSQRSIASCGQTGVWWVNVYTNFGRYVEKWNINVWRLNAFACWTCSLFSFNSQCCSTLASCKRKLLGKTNCTDWLRSKYKWRHSNDVIVIKFAVYVPN